MAYGTVLNNQVRITGDILWIVYGTTDSKVDSRDINIDLKLKFTPLVESDLLPHSIIFVLTRESEFLSSEREQVFE